MISRLNEETCKYYLVLIFFIFTLCVIYAYINDIYASLNMILFSSSHATDNLLEVAKHLLLIFVYIVSK